MKNSIMILHPYFHRGSWVFDDEYTGLVKEPFVAGVPEVLEILLDKQKIIDPKKGFSLIFSETAFPEYQLELKWQSSEFSGNWYTVNIDGKEMRGWLCPALFLYFSIAPKKLFVKVQNDIHD